MTNQGNESAQASSRDYLEPVRESARYLGDLITEGGSASPDDARWALINFAGAILDAARAEAQR